MDWITHLICRLFVQKQNNFKFYGDVLLHSWVELRAIFLEDVSFISFFSF